jgi:hypothetical protein
MSCDLEYLMSQNEDYANEMLVLEIEDENKEVK